MPNHFVTVGLVAGGRYLSLESFGFMDLCDLVLPMPEALKSIHLGQVTIDGARHSIWQEVDGKEVPVEDPESLGSQYGAVNSIDWARCFWGTKWGTYGLKVHPIDGDGSPGIVTFQSAWGPPSKLCMRLIDDLVREEAGKSYCVSCEIESGSDEWSKTMDEFLHGKDRTSWHGMQPYDMTVCPIEMSSDEELRAVEPMVRYFRAIRGGIENEIEAARLALNEAGLFESEVGRIAQ